MPKQKISVVFIGSIHRDPAPYVIVKNMILACRKLNIQCLFCEEDIADRTLNSRLEGNHEFLKNNTFFLQNKFIQQFFIKREGLSRPYIPLEKAEKLKSVLVSNFPQVNFLMFDEAVWGLLRHNGYNESVKFTKTLIDLKIPYMGIEAPRKQYELSIDNEQYVSYEQNRIKIMMDNFFSKALTHYSDDFIVFVFTGVNHTHRLAANFWLRYTQNQDLNKNYDLKFFPLKIFSPYVLDGIEDHQCAVLETMKNDSAQVLETYAVLRTYEIMCQEMGEQFVSDELEKISADIFNHVKHKPVTFIIPDWDEDKKNLILHHKGEILNVDKNHYATIKIVSDVLIKDLRLKLGIDRRLITFSVSAIERCELLKGDKTITIEPTAQTNKFLVTFPQNRLYLVEKVVNDWGQVIANFEFFKKKISDSQCYPSFIKFQKQWHTCENIMPNDCNESRSDNNSTI